MSEDLLARRRRLLGPNVPTFYDQPVEIVRGEGVWLWDAEGTRYLDCYNNVPHVGHCHPKVVEAIATQSALLNTHTRYLHRGILDYAERLTSLFDHELKQLLVACTGSEANDIALRMAQAVTGKTGIIATDNTYHGNTSAVSALSTRRPPIGGYPGHVRLIPAPDSVAPVGGSLEAQPQAFARNLHRAIVDLEDAGHGFAALILCPAFANEGLPALSPAFLEPAVGLVRRARGLIIADEVQPGFGRVGSHFWGHQALGFAPDIVTLGKPMGNGYPVAGVVTRPEIMAEFREAFGYFNTFGGNPVAMAAATAVLDVLEEEGLVENARKTGAYMQKALRGLSHPGIVEVRGKGLFFGIEFARDGEPDGAAAAWMVEAMKARGVLLGRVGRKQQVLKLRPPMPFQRAQADEVVEKLAACLAELPQ
ncbi:aspartate aminotransferase family protein [Frigidibacter sp. ROC022]|uniref:aspartate aminotransferase family protein n=1 Tax=Frigidibacter sp. ROC022 TaxID=2971796 RepID=UPI00215A4D57|nr:aspartate aminotransferase family protein [Frigidibacter sp. ROC022]MCR8724708.1 aspartate aminotransferase family protein [Frigidibacter sp. ROC022]